MKSGIIGLPQVGKTSLFKILTKVDVATGHGGSREAHLGVATVPDERLDKLAALYNPKKTTHATIQYVDVAANRHGLGFRDVLALLRANPGTTAGLGAGLFVLLFVPLLNLFLVPAAVVAGTHVFSRMRPLGMAR